MPELTILSTFDVNSEKNSRPIVRIGMSEYSHENAKQIILGPGLMTKSDIDNQIDDLIRQLELTRVEAKNYLAESQTS